MEHEKHLEFYKTYNKVNCEQECLASTSLKHCGCVQFFMAREPQTRICGVADEKCFRKAEHLVKQSKKICECFDECDRIRYDVAAQNTGAIE